MSEIDLHPPSEEERARWPASVIVPLETPFADARGAIQPLVDLPMKSCVLISSKKGRFSGRLFPAMRSRNGRVGFRFSNSIPHP